jgi:FkbM family methyltransferase
MNRVTAARYWLKRLLCWVVVPILGGPSKGAWFGLFTGTRFIRGTYGQAEIALFAKLVSPGHVVLDVGAHAGYFTLLASRAVGSSGKVIAFEPLPVNLAYLRSHRFVNRLSNVQIAPVAVGGSDGEMSLDLRSGTGRGRLSTTNTPGDCRVRVVALDSMLARNELPRVDVIKMDVEGAECEALRGAFTLLSRWRPALILSVHGLSAKRECQEILEQIGYCQTQVQKSLLVAVPPDHREAEHDEEERRKAA